MNIEIRINSEDLDRFERLIERMERVAGNLPIPPVYVPTIPTQPVPDRFWRLQRYICPNCGKPIGMNEYHVCCGTFNDNHT